MNVKTANQEFNLLGKLKYGLQLTSSTARKMTYTYTGVGLVRTRPDFEYPDIQYHFVSFSLANYTDEGIEMQKEAAINFQPNVNSSRSRGFLELLPPIRTSSRNPAEPFSDPYDIETLMAGARIARAALNSGVRALRDR